MLKQDLMLKLMSVSKESQQRGRYDYKLIVNLIIRHCADSSLSWNCEYRYHALSESLITENCSLFVYVISIKNLSYRLPQNPSDEKT